MGSQTQSGGSTQGSGGPGGGGHDTGDKRTAEEKKLGTTTVPDASINQEGEREDVVYPINPNDPGGEPNDPGEPPDDIERVQP